MAREYGKVGPKFWTGETGRALRPLGADARLAALYLVTCGSANMIGLYYLPAALMAHELGCSFEGASKALRSLRAVGFCEVDETRDLVWVREMVRYQVGEALKRGDKRVAHIEAQLAEHSASPLVAEFRRKYHRAFALQPPPDGESGLSEAPCDGPTKGASKGLRKPLPQAITRALEAPPKPESSEQRSEDRETPRARVAPLVMCRRLHAAFEWPRGCVPQDLHADLVAKLGGEAQAAEAQLFALYREVADAWPQNEAVGPDDWGFWRARFAERFAAPRVERARAAGAIPEPAAWSDPWRVWHCHHGADPCRNRTACELRTARDVGKGHVQLEDVPPLLRKAVSVMAEAYRPDEAVHA